MAELILGARTVETVFDLRGRDENAMTFALAWAMSKSDRLLKGVLARVTETTFDPGGAVISIQRADDLGITDIEVRVADRLHVIVEAKRDWTLPMYEQLDRYAQLLDRNVADYRLAVLTQWGATNYASRRIASFDLGVPVEVVGWEDVLGVTREAAAVTLGRERATLKELATYLSRVVDMRDIDSNRCYVVSLSRATHPHVPIDFITIVEHHHRYTYPATGGGWPKVPPNYMGFRFRGELQYVCHVDDYAVTTNKSEFFPGTPSVEHDADFILTLGPFIRPKTRVPAGPKVRRNSRVWADIDLLLTADSITDAVRLTKARRSEGGPL